MTTREIRADQVKVGDVVELEDWTFHCTMRWVPVAQISESSTGNTVHFTGFHDGRTVYRTRRAVTAVEVRDDDSRSK